MEGRHYIESILYMENQDSREGKGLVFGNSYWLTLNVWSFDITLVSSFLRGLSCLVGNLCPLVGNPKLFCWCRLGPGPSHALRRVYFYCSADHLEAYTSYVVLLGEIGRSEAATSYSQR